jgi:hypothetical protein
VFDICAEDEHPEHEYTSGKCDLSAMDLDLLGSSGS